MSSPVTILHGKELSFEDGECTYGQLDVYTQPFKDAITVAYVLTLKQGPFVMLSGTDEEVTAILSLMLEGEAVSRSEVDVEENEE